MMKTISETWSNMGKHWSSRLLSTGVGHFRKIFYSFHTRQRTEFLIALRDNMGRWT